MVAPGRRGNISISFISRGPSNNNNNIVMLSKDIKKKPYISLKTSIETNSSSNLSKSS